MIDGIHCLIDERFVTIKKGAIIQVPNPDWDGDKSETQFHFDCEADEDFTVFIGSGSGTHPVQTKILKRIDGEDND